jgi:hypothetical protein
MGKRTAIIATGTLCCVACIQRSEARGPERADAGGRALATSVERGSVDASPPFRSGPTELTGLAATEFLRRRPVKRQPGIKPCLEARTENQGGRVVIQFAIAANGKVIAAVAKESPLRGSPTERCLIQAIRKWEFPKPLGGGIVIVNYPIDVPPLPE